MTRCSRGIASSVRLQQGDPRHSHAREGWREHPSALYADDANTTKAVSPSLRFNSVFCESGRERSSKVPRIKKNLADIGFRPRRGSWVVSAALIGVLPLTD